MVGSPEPQRLNWADMDDSDDEMSDLDIPAVHAPRVWGPGATATLAESDRELAAQQMREEAERHRQLKAAAMSQATTPATPDMPPKQRVWPSVRDSATATAATPSPVNSTPQTDGTPHGLHQAHTAFPSTPGTTPLDYQAQYYAMQAAAYHASSHAMPAERFHYAPHRAMRFEAQRKLVQLLSESAGQMSMQDLSKQLDWKRCSYSRLLGSLYAFLKRDCKHLVTCTWGNVALRDEVAGYAPMPTTPADAPASVGSHEADEEEADAELLDEGSHSSSSHGAQAQGQEAEAAPSEEGRKGGADVQAAGGGGSNPGSAKATPVLAAKSHEVTDIAQSLLSMMW